MSIIVAEILKLKFANYIPRLLIIDESSVVLSFSREFK